MDHRASSERQITRPKGEHWWPVVLSIAVAAALHVALPAQYRVQPAWVVPTVLFVLVATLIIAAITLANIVAAVRLVHDILSNNKIFANNADGLLATGAVIWVTNIIAFSLWYWDLDRGGAAARAQQPNREPAFVFPEMQHIDVVAQPWTPRFVDYLSLGFWTATAFSPTDVSAVKPWAKMLMMVEAAASLALAGLVIARAINVL